TTGGDNRTRPGSPRRRPSPCALTGYAHRAPTPGLRTQRSYAMLPPGAGHIPRPDRVRVRNLHPRWTPGPRQGGARRAEQRRGSEPERFDYVAVGYTDRRELDDFIDGEYGDLVVRGPDHTGSEVQDIETLGPGATRGTPCLVVPLIHERMDEIQREVESAIARYRTGAAPAEAAARDTARAEGRAAGERAPGREARAQPRTIGETGGSARGTSSGAIRLGADRPDSAERTPTSDD